MVAMPYILVNMVLEIFSWVLLCTTGAALLSKYPLTNRYLPAPVRKRRILAFLAQGLVLAVISVVPIRVVTRGGSTALAQPVFEVFFYIGFANVVVLTYQFLDKRFLRTTPKVLRRLVIAISAAVLTSAAAIGVFAAAVGLFVIR